MNPQNSAKLESLSEKIATELVFAEAGKDLGLLPVNSLLGEMEELLAEPDVPEALKHAAEPPRRWLDHIFETTGTFGAGALKCFAEWTVWWQQNLRAVENENPPPPLPGDWDGVVGQAPSTPAPAAAAAGEATEEPVLVLNLPEDRDLLAEFAGEAQEHLQNIEQGVLVLEDHPTDADTLNSIFRAFHTFKGGSGFLNLKPIQTLAHDLESLLDLARQHKLTITPEVINIILEGGDVLRRFISEIGARLNATGTPGTIQVPTLGLLARVRGVIGAGPAEKAAAGRAEPPSAPEASPAVPVAATPVAAVSAGAPAEAAAKPVAGEGAPARAAGATKGGAVANSVKVDTQKLDSLVDLVGEMVIAQSLVVQSRDLSGLRSEQLTRDLGNLSRISKDLQRTAMSLRMVPIRATFQKMNRLVRDLTAKVGKQVELATAGEDTELDRTIVEEISDPLVHMIRNSIDHGIELPEVRLQKGKPARGTVWLKAYHQGGNIVIEIQDDGKGLDRDRILAKAIENGLVQPGEQLAESEIFNLIMAAGLSTAEKVTDLSGRGVGMDVVRRNIEKLRGKIEIQSTMGKGSTFKIFLPLTMAIIDGLVVGVGEHRYIIPTLSVCESFRPAPEMIKTIHGQAEMIPVRGRLRPLLRLYEHLGIKPTSTNPAESLVIVVESGVNARCVLVDQLIGKQEVVIKSLGETFSKNRYVAGAAILGDGGVGLILDPQALVYLESAPLEAAA